MRWFPGWFSVIISDNFFSLFEDQKYKAKQSAKPASETKPVQEEPAKPASAEEA